MGAASSRGEPSQIVDVAPKIAEEPKSPAEKPKKREKEEHKRIMVERKKLPHNYETIMKEAENPSLAKLHDHIYTGVLLNHKRKKYWVDEKSGCNCFMLFAKELSITWSDNPLYWRWLPLKEASDEEIETASLLNVCWLEVHGNLYTSFLTPLTTYEVAFVVMIKDPAYGWEHPVNLRLVGPDGGVQEHTESLLDKPRGRWIELVAGEFQTTADDHHGSKVQFSLFEYEGGEWKKGLIVKGSVIRPKKLNILKGETF